MKKTCEISTPTLIIDTSFGATVAVVDDNHITMQHESNSHSHVEELIVHITSVVAQAHLTLHDIQSVIVGVGPAPFTGLRAGIAAAKVCAFARNIPLFGQDILFPLALWNTLRLSGGNASITDVMEQYHSNTSQQRHLTFAVNDARRKQLYGALYDDEAHDYTAHIAMDIDYAQSWVQRINEVVDHLQQLEPESQIIVDIIGNGATRYDCSGITALGMVREGYPLHENSADMQLLYDCACRYAVRDAEVKPLYLRRPDVTISKAVQQAMRNAGVDIGQDNAQANCEQQGTSATTHSESVADNLASSQSVGAEE